MSANSTPKLVSMANQIATAFEGQRLNAAYETSRHIRLFWSRPMREQIVRHFNAGGEGLSDTARQAIDEVAQMAATDPPRIRV
jgi:formate dehydrogenase subunit delta